MQELGSAEGTAAAVLARHGGSCFLWAGPYSQKQPWVEKKKRKESSLMVETGARERTSNTQKNQRAAEQRETEERRDVGDELKMAAWLFLLLFSSLNTDVSVSETETRIGRQQKLPCRSASFV